jgi:hypothetical protein
MKKPSKRQLENFWRVQKETGPVRYYQWRMGKIVSRNFSSNPIWGWFKTERDAIEDRIEYLSIRIEDLTKESKELKKLMNERKKK